MRRGKEVFTIKDVADYLDVHPMTIYKYVKQDKIPAFKIGTSWRIRKEAIHQWIEENEQKRREKT